MEGDTWITSCSKQNTKWANYEVLAKRIYLKSPHYCAYECEQNPFFCTHWAQEKNHSKCTLYFGEIDAPSPGLIASGVNKQAYVGTRLCRKGGYNIHNILYYWIMRYRYMFMKLCIRLFV